MKAFLAVSIFCLSFSLPSFGAQLDPEYKDDTIWRIYRVVEMSGALQPDNTAVEAGANEWAINVELVDLPGDSKKAVDTAWNALIEKEQAKILSELRNMYPDTIPANATSLTDEISQKIKSEADGTAFVQQGFDDEGIRQWFNDELLTRAGRANTAFYFESNYRKQFEFFRFHKDDQSMEVIGDDLLMIRGVKQVVIIRISYVHS